MEVGHVSKGIRPGQFLTASNGSVFAAFCLFVSFLSLSFPVSSCLVLYVVVYLHVFILSLQPSQIVLDWLGRRIFCAGHSRGAQMAALCSVFVKSVAPEANVVSVMSGTSVRHPDPVAFPPPPFAFGCLLWVPALASITNAVGASTPLKKLAASSTFLSPEHIFCPLTRSKSYFGCCAWLQASSQCPFSYLWGQLLPLPVLSSLFSFARPFPFHSIEPNVTAPEILQDS